MLLKVLLLLLKLFVVFPQWALPSPTLTDCVCVIWAMISCPECWFNVEMVQEFVGVLEELMNFP